MIGFIFCYCCYYNITWVLYCTTLTYLKMVLDYIKSKCRKLLFFLSNCSNSPNLRIETQHGIVIEQVASKPGEVLKRTEKNLQCLFQSAKIDTLLEGVYRKPLFLTGGGGAPEQISTSDSSSSKSDSKTEIESHVKFGRPKLKSFSGSWSNFPAFVKVLKVCTRRENLKFKTAIKKVYLNY